MKIFSIEDKQNLLTALDQFIDSLETTRSILHDTGNENGNALAPALTKFGELRVKLILNIEPIKFRTEDDGNINIYDSWRTKCYLCGVYHGISFPQTPVIAGHDVCPECLKKHNPEIYKTITENNEKFRVQREYDRSEEAMFEGQELPDKNSLQF